MQLCSDFRSDYIPGRGEEVLERPVAITIRNKETEAIIRRLGARRREGPSAVIARLAKEELKREGQVSREEYARRMAAWDELMSLAPPRDPNATWEDFEAEMQSLFDYLDEDVPVRA
jgi:hypothetical protein